MMCVRTGNRIHNVAGIHNKNKIHTKSAIWVEIEAPGPPGADSQVENRSSSAGPYARSTNSDQAPPKRMRPKLGQPLLSIVRNRGPARISLGTRIELREFKSSQVESSQVKSSRA
jgi:hypothetical protein